MVQIPKIFSKSKFFRFSEVKTRQNLVIKFGKIEKTAEENAKKPSNWLIVLTLVAIVIVQSYYPSAQTKASGQTSISKTSTTDWAKGTNSGVSTSSDEVKLSSVDGWASDNYAYRKQLTVSAQASNTVTKGHTLNAAGVGSGTFDGSGDYFDTGDTLNSTTLPVTIEAWVKITGAAPNGNGWAIYASDDGGTTYAGFWMLIDQNRNVFLSYGDNGGQFSTNRRSKLSTGTVSLDTWTHVSGVIRGATDMSIYLNGVDAGGAYSGTTNGAMTHNSNIGKIGLRSIAVTPNMRGNIDEVRIWSKSRTDAEVLADMYKEIDAQSNLEAYYKFNQSSGTMADSSGHSLTATAAGDAGYSPYSYVWGGIDTKSLVDAGKMRSDGNDLRVYYGSNEIERELVPANGKTLATSEATQVLFKAQAQVAGGATDNGYYLYYGDSDGVDPIVNIYEKKFRVKNAFITPYAGNGANYLQYNVDNFPTNGDGTFEFWYKGGNNGARHVASGPIFSGEDSNNTWSWWYDRGGYRLYARVGGNTILPSDPGNNNDSRDWNHAVLTWHNTDTNAQIKVYENGVKTYDASDATKITSWPNYIKFIDNLSSYDGLELGMVAIFNTAKDDAWASSEYTRSQAMPIANGVRDSSATFIHNFDGSSLDATSDNGGYASGTSTVTNQGTEMSGDYRQGDTSDERAGNSWVTGVYNWYDNFDTAGKSPRFTENGKISAASNEIALTNGQQLIVNKQSSGIPANFRMEVQAKGTQPELLFNYQDKIGWWGNSICALNITSGGDVNSDLGYPRDATTNFLTGATSKYYLGLRNGFTPKYIQFDLASAGSYTGIAWEYWNGSTWTAFTPTSDTTANFTKSGLVDISNIAASYGINPPADGGCGFNGNFNVLRVSATAVTTAAAINQVSRIQDFAKSSYTTTTNAIAGDSHNASGSTTITRSASDYKTIGLRRVGTGLQNFFDDRMTINSTTNAVFDYNFLGLSATTDATFDNFKIYKALASEPSTAQASEVSKYTTGSYYSSPTSISADSGIINLGWIGDWGTPTGFSANVTIPTNTSIEFKVRSSSVAGSNDADWTDWATIGSATTTGEYSVAHASMPNITLGLNKYLQIKATLNTTDGVSTPTLSDYTIYYVADTDAPTNPSVSSLTVNGTSVAASSWTSASGAVLAQFSGSTDPDSQSGVTGYYIYFGTSSAADPVVNGAYQAHVGAVGDTQSYTSTIATSDDGKYYYLIYKTKDGAENISNSSTLYQFGYDQTSPTKPSFVSVSPLGYTTSNSFTFTWPAASDPDGGNGASGIKYYEYRRGNEVSWSHTLDSSQTSVASLQAYQEGANAFYVRTVDRADNIASSYSQVTYYWSGTAPDKPSNLAVSPDTADENNFVISWDKPSVAEGNPPVAGYYYSINASPTLNNITYIASTASHVELPASSYATRQGANIVYVLSVNQAGNFSLEESYIAQATFNCQTAAPPIPVSVSISDTTNRAYNIYSLTTKWSAGTGQNQTSFDHYTIERSTDAVNYSELATTTSTAYIDASNLNNSTTYYYRIKAVDDAGSTSAVSTVVFKTPTGKYQTPPNYLSNPQTSNIKSSSATVSWTTDRASNSIVKYGKTQSSLSASSGQLDSVLNHVVELLGLEPSTTYYYQAQSLDNERDYQSDEANSEMQSFTTLAAPAISNVNVSNVTLSSADVTWETTTLAVSSLNYGNNSNLDKTLDDISGSNTTKHSVKLTDLGHSTRYGFRISGTDADNNELTSDLYYFETLPMPRVENLKLEIVKDKSRPAIKVNWNTNVATSSIVKYSGSEETPKEEVKAKLVTEHEIVIDDLNDETNYRVAVSGMDSIGNLTAESTATILTPQDSRPPQISEITIETSNVGLNRQDKAQVVISWKTDEPATSRIEYGVGLNGDNYEKQTSEDANLTTNHVVILSDLEPTSPYHVKINSKDKSGNLAKSDDQVVVSSEVPKSVLRVLLNALEGAFGWIKI